MRLLICGDRNWTRRDIILREVKALMMCSSIECIIEGEARGADYMGRSVGEELGIPVLRFPANWEKYGKSAGPIRNMEMLKEGKPTQVLAFHNNIEESKGTKHMVKIAQEAGVPFFVIRETEYVAMYASGE